MFRLFSILLLSILVPTIPVSAQRDCKCYGSITEKEFSKDTANFKRIFFENANDKKHTEWIYFPKNYFTLLYRFLNASPGADGLWIYFVTRERMIDNNLQTRDDQILFNLIASINGKPNFEKLKQFATSSTILNSGNLVELSTRRNQVSSRITHDFFLKRNEADVLADSLRYKKQNPDTKYSQRLFICKAQIDQIYNTILGLNFGGVKFYFASYDELRTCVGNQVKEQLTLILAPVKNRNSGPDFVAIKNYLTTKLRITEAEVFNHGSLCPNDCEQ